YQRCSTHLASLQFLIPRSMETSILDRGRTRVRRGANLIKKEELGREVIIEEEVATGVSISETLIVVVSAALITVISAVTRHHIQSLDTATATYKREGELRINTKLKQPKNQNLNNHERG
ncbi:unnamed protein product, partial [Vicia faba]